MIDVANVFAIDGHDGSGKTTLAQIVAKKSAGSYQRPFSGALGAEILRVASLGDTDTLISLGSEGILNAIAAAGDRRPIILDRGWMTIASLTDWDTFKEEWELWIPTALCWADLSLTLDRLNQRSEKAESVECHIHFLDAYRLLAERTDCAIIRTDLFSQKECGDLILEWIQENPGVPSIESRLR